MILADTSIWIDHLRKADAELAELLNKNEIVMHPFIMGEILLGSRSKRADIETSLTEMPQAIKASDKEVLFFIRSAKVFGRGIGWVDTHLLVSAQLTGRGFGRGIRGWRVWLRNWGWVTLRDHMFTS